MDIGQEHRDVAVSSRLALVYRYAVGLIGVMNIGLAVALFRQPSWLADLWPWEAGYDGMAPLSYAFLSSIAAAIGAPLLWIAASGALGASAAGAFNLAVAFGGIAATLAVSATADPSNPRLAPASIVMGVAALANLVICALTVRLPALDERRMPVLVRASFLAFTLTLIAVGTALVTGRPGVLPWDLTPEMSAVYGWIFLGAATYFAYAVARPLWEYAVGPLLGFLAYDAVLIVPFVQHFADVPLQLRTSLIVYTAVVVYSGALAVYFLFIHRGTRLRYWSGK